MFSIIWLPCVSGTALDTETLPVVGMGSDQTFDVSVNAE
jgi:hypothetical protein